MDGDTKSTAGPVFLIGAWWMEDKKVNVAFLSIGMDYFQVLSIFARIPVKWPRWIKTVLQVLSVFNFNIDIASDEKDEIITSDNLFFFFQKECCQVKDYEQKLKAEAANFIYAKQDLNTVCSKETEIKTKEECSEALGALGL